MESRFHAGLQYRDEDDVESRSREAIVEQFNALDSLPDPDKTGYRSDLDGWMRKART